MYTTDRRLLVETIQEKLQELSNEPLDLSPNSNISRYIDIVSIADDNILFYLALLFNEINLETALLPETIINFCKLTGIPYNKAKHAVTTAYLYIELDELDNDRKFILTPDMKFSALDIPFRLDGVYEIVYDSGLKKVFGKKEIDNIYYPVSTNLDILQGKHYCVVEIVLEQYSTSTIELNTDSPLYEYEIRKESDFIEKFKVYVNGREIPEVSSIYLLSNTQYTYTVQDERDSYKLVFATEIQGIPITNSEIKILAYHTYGAKGNVSYDSIVPNFSLQDQYSDYIANISVKNPYVENGRDPENLVDLKKHIYDYFLSRNKIIARYPDLKNIKHLVDPICKHPATTLSVNIAPELTIFYDLTLQNDILETTTAKTTHVLKKSFQNKPLHILDIENDNTVDFTKSNEIFFDYYINLTDKSLINPYEMKLNVNQNSIDYYYKVLNETLSISNVYISKVSEHDNLTTIAPGVILLKNNLETGELEFFIEIEATGDIDPNLASAFTFSIHLEDQENNIKETFTNNDITFTSIDSLNSKYTELLEFSIDSSKIEPDIIYKLVIEIKYNKTSTILYLAETQLTKLHRKMPIFSRYDIVGKCAEIGFTGITDNPVLTSDAFVKLLHFEPYKELDLYIGINDFDFTKISRVYSTFTTTLEDYTIDAIWTIVSKSNDYIHVKLEKVPEIVILEDMRITLKDNQGFKLEFNFNARNYKYIDDILEIYHVPYLTNKSYKYLVKKNSLNVLTDVPNYLNDTLSNQLVFGAKPNFKFIRTYGHIENIKYNKNIVYEDKYINYYELPLKIKLELIVDLDFSEADADVLKLDLLQTLTPDVINGKLQRYKIFEIISNHKKIKSAKIVEPETDIIYDFDESEFLQEIYTYVPELITLRKENIIINYSTKGVIT